MSTFTRFVRPLSATAAGLIATAGLASAAEAATPIGETGRIELASTVDAGVIGAVTLRNAYVDPVVVAFINTRNGNESVQVRVSDVTATGFSVFMEEPDGQAHNAEQVSYIVMERGTHFLADGRKVEAGSVATDTMHVGGQPFAGDAVAFETDFADAPAVLHGLNSYANGDFMASMATAVDADGFQIGLEAAETGATAAVETVAYIALETGEGTLDGAAYTIGAGADGSSDGVGQAAHVISFSGFGGTPDVIVSVIGQNGADGAWARGGGLFSPNGQSVYAEEDQIKDSERGHADEAFAFAAFPADSDLMPAAGHLKWRLRNATETPSTQWVVRELSFCADSACAEPLAGTPFDNGEAPEWGIVDQAFDGDDSTFWKTFDVAAGNSYLGLEFERPQVVAGIDLDMDNVVYIPDGYFVEYFDADADAWVTADYIAGSTGDIQTAVTQRDRFPTAWRVRTAVATYADSNWAVRELDFCADAACAEVLSGDVIDSGDAFEWAPASNAFDDDTSTFYKSSHDTAGALYLGLDFGAITEVGGLYMRTDNIVYTADELFVEYYDVVAGEWVTADYLMGFAGSADHTLAISVRDRFPVSWRLVNTVETNGGNNWAIRELAFCSDTACAEQPSGAAFDGGTAFEWAPVENAFDGDTSTFWKTTSPAAGQSIGLDFDGITEVSGLYMRTDNIVYTADEVEVQYYDIVSGAWESAATISGFAGSADHTIALD